MAQKHAACALWGLSEENERHVAMIIELGAVAPLLALIQDNNVETRGFAAATLKNLSANKKAQGDIREAEGVEPLQMLARGPKTWLSSQAVEMLGKLGVAVRDDLDFVPTLALPVRAEKEWDPESGEPPPSPELSTATSRTARTARDGFGTSRTVGGTPKMNFHFFSFQTQRNVM